MFTILQTIGQDCWQSSTLMTLAGEIPPAVTESHPAATTYALLLCLIYFMIFVESSFFSVAISWRSLFNRIALEDTIANKNLIYSINNTVLLCIPLLALVLYFLNVSQMHFIFILCALVVFGAVHYGLFMLVGWLKQCIEMMRAVSICGRMHLVVFTTFALVLLAVFALAGIHSARAATIALAAAFGLLFILRAYRSRRIFAENNFSLLFWFLYLCTLEILPLGVLICVLTRI